MKVQLEQYLAVALANLQDTGTVPRQIRQDISVVRTRDAAHGDFTSNLALELARPAGREPLDMAQALLDALPASDLIRKAVIAGPGFINFFLTTGAQSAVIATILAQQGDYGRSRVGAQRRLHVQCVPALPVEGPLSVEQGRSVALSSSIARLLEAIGFDVQRELYLRIACIPEAVDTENEAVEERSEEHDSQRIHDASVEYVPSLESKLTDVRHDLQALGVPFDRWLGRWNLVDDAQRVLDQLESCGHLYEAEGVSWFRSTAFGDDKDRALLHAPGQRCGFSDLAFDIACIDQALRRGIDQLLVVHGGARQSYGVSLLAAIEALGHTRDKLNFLQASSTRLVCQSKVEPHPRECSMLHAEQYSGGGSGTYAGSYSRPNSMQRSTLSGSRVTLCELVDEIGKDAACFFYVMRKYSHSLEFDVELAKMQSNDNPVYHVQFAYARVCSVLRQLEHRQLTFDQCAGLAALGRLTETDEAELMTMLAMYPALMQRAALAHEPNQVTGHLRDLANGLHKYYCVFKASENDDELRHGRVCLLLAVRQVLGNGLALLDVSTPEVK